LSFFDSITNFFGFGRAAAPAELSGAKGSGSGSAVHSAPPSRDVRGLLGLYNTSSGYRRVGALVADRVGSTEAVLAKRQIPLTANHPFRQLWDQPNPYMTGAEWRALDCLYLDNAGECFTALVDSGDGRVELYPLPPHWVTPVWGGIGRRVEFMVKLGDSGVEQKWTDSEIVWIKRVDPLDPYGRGSGLGRACLDEIETAEYAARHTKAYFYNSATPPVVIGLPGANPAQVKEFKQLWNDQLQGLQKAWRTHFTSHNVVVHQLSAPLKDQNVTAVMQSSNDEIRMTFGVSPELLGQLSSSNRATILEAETIFATNCLEPRLRKLYAGYRERLLRLLPAPYADGVTLTYVSPIPDDVVRRDKVMTERSWAFTINEHRASVGLPERADGEAYMVPAKMARVEAGKLKPAAKTYDAAEPNQVALVLIQDDDERTAA
jgi:HK97 family phage portal protein